MVPFVVGVIVACGGLENLYNMLSVFPITQHCLLLLLLLVLVLLVLLVLLLAAFWC